MHIFATRKQQKTMAMKISTQFIKPLYNFFLMVLLSLTISCSHESYTIRLDEMAYKEIVNTYSTPKRNVSFPGKKLNINGKTFEHGLGLHAPAELNIDLHGKGLFFDAKIGIDSAKYYYHNDSGLITLCRQKTPWFPADYVYDNNKNHNDFTAGGTAIVKILLDGKEVYSSGIMTANDSAKTLHIPLQKAKTITIKALPTEDGSFTDFVDLAEAKITVSDTSKKYEIYNHPKTILVNHVGFHPKAPKMCYMHGTQATDFELVDAENQKVVFTGKMVYKPGNIGEYLVGNFTAFYAPGNYFLRTGDKKSLSFRIDNKVISDCLKKHVSYIRQQRSGHPTVGWNANQHLDDGIRDDNKKHQNVSGGWYDACDVRKPAKTNVDLLFALVKLAMLKPGWLETNTLEEEMQWGNKFLLAMQEPEGYLMRSLGFGEYKTSDNRWTDNIIGNEDDRYIQTEPAETPSQVHFVITQLELAQYFKDSDAGYSTKCLNAATKCYNWIYTKDTIEEIDAIALSVIANCKMFKYSEDKKYEKEARKWLQKLSGYKVENDSIPITIFGRKKRDNWHSFEAQYIVEAHQTFVQTFPNSKKRDYCLETIKNYCTRFFIQFQNQNAFHLMPFGVIKDKKFSAKHINEFYYRNFLHVGLNKTIASKAYDMLQAKKIVQNKEKLLQRAQQQLDWIYGANPFNASYVTGLGENQPALFRAGDYAYKPPHTPEIIGGVMTGIGADKNDNMALYPGWWWTTEYWAPTVSAVVLLNTELYDIYK